MSKKINIEFDILETGHPYFFSIADLSEWGLIKDNTSYISITLPGYSKPVEKYFDKNAVNTYNSFSLEISCGDICQESEYEAIPDGIYCIELKSTCDKYVTSKKYFRTVILELELDKIIISNIKCDGKRDKSILDKITEIEFDIKSAKANLRYDNINEASQLYQKACNSVEELKNCM